MIEEIKINDGAFIQISQNEKDYFGNRGTIKVLTKSGLWGEILLDGQDVRTLIKQLIVLDHRPVQPYKDSDFHWGVSSEEEEYPL